MSDSANSQPEERRMTTGRLTHERLERHRIWAQEVVDQMDLPTLRVARARLMDLLEQAEHEWQEEVIRIRGEIVHAAILRVEKGPGLGDRFSRWWSVLGASQKKCLSLLSEIKR
jgi:hypothetical protein